MSHLAVFAITLSFGFALICLIGLICLAVRINALEANPPELAPEPEKSKPSCLEIKTRTGTTRDYGTNIRYPSNGQLVISVDDKVSSIFAAGHWLSFRVVAEPLTEAKKEEPVAPFLHDTTI